MTILRFIPGRNIFGRSWLHVRKTKRGDRVAVTTMTFDATEPLIADLTKALAEAAKSGANVLLCMDAFTFMWDDDRGLPGPLWRGILPTDKLRRPFGESFAALEEIRAHGGRYAITNMPKRAFSLPQRGRSHIKGAVINDKLYIGGNNLRAPEQTDLMVSWHDQRASDWLFIQFDRMASTQNTRLAFGDDNLRFVADNGLEIFIDAGVPGQSIILDTALQLIDEADDWVTLTCQYFPGGRTAQHLLAAYKRGVKVHILFSHPYTHGKEALGHYVHNLRERTRLPKELFVGRQPKYAPRLHAKLLATDKGAMLGSHNYVTQGVSLGTAEIALLRRDPDFSKLLVDFIRQQLP